MVEAPRRKIPGKHGQDSNLPDRESLGEKKPTLPTYRPQTSSPWDYEKTHFCSANHPACHGFFWYNPG